MRNQLLEKQLPQAAVAAPDGDQTPAPPSTVLGEPRHPWRHGCTRDCNAVKARATPSAMVSAPYWPGRRCRTSTVGVSCGAKRTQDLSCRICFGVQAPAGCGGWTSTRRGC